MTIDEFNQTIRRIVRKELEDLEDGELLTSAGLVVKYNLNLLIREEFAQELEERGESTILVDEEEMWERLDIPDYYLENDFI